MPLAYPQQNCPDPVYVVKTGEKGSDVNLATYLLADAFQQDCEVAIVVSNDSDLVEPIKIARRKTGIDVGVLNPERKKKRRATSLYQVASFQRIIQTRIR
jgi:hypothetical protein